jgi:hypothetical protein
MGSSERLAPLAGVWGTPPNFQFPQDWGIQGVDKKLIDDLLSRLPLIEYNT